jgi:Ca-activated chloride channel family protein
MRFAQPLAFWLLLTLPVLGLLWQSGHKRRAGFLQQFGDRHLLQQSPPRLPWLHKKWLYLTFLCLPFLCVIFALSDPRSLFGPLRLRHNALDVVLLIDVSTSMAAEDYGSRSRLTQARQIVQRLLPSLRGNRIGLVTYAGASFRQAELTDDLETLAFILKHWVVIDAVGVGGSHLVQALETGLDLFTYHDDRTKIMLLLSDGGSTAHDVQGVLTKARDRDVKIVALGLGSLQPSRIPRYNAQKQFVGYVEVDGRAITSRLNEPLLQRLADATHGTYVRIVHGNEGLELFRHPTIMPSSLWQQAERRLFQPVLLLGLIAFGVHTLLQRL